MVSRELRIEILEALHKGVLRPFRHPIEHVAKSISEASVDCIPSPEARGLV